MLSSCLATSERSSFTGTIAQDADRRTRRIWNFCCGQGGLSCKAFRNSKCSPTWKHFWKHQLDYQNGPMSHPPWHHLSSCPWLRWPAEPWLGHWPRANAPPSRCGPQPAAWHRRQDRPSGWSANPGMGKAAFEVGRSSQNLKNMFDFFGTFINSWQHIFIVIWIMWIITLQHRTKDIGVCAMIKSPSDYNCSNFGNDFTITPCQKPIRFPMMRASGS